MLSEEEIDNAAVLNDSRSMMTMSVLVRVGGFQLSRVLSNTLKFESISDNEPGRDGTQDSDVWGFRFVLFRFVSFCFVLLK